ncbi:glycosyltransferase involved in cell wall biosynthesis [Palleronia aestuarii]|uniref:Glycosyltransferase involved in cell wall biosynthesis n=1 Tax=Palleronia aestuarii TaxID=568105 RepID=A0A2W7NAV4_9RHOB|nr:glycosyltransferase family 4 protein [Palleronia aestuarii]PZX17130.1 glycosyltransferase involved in cell wall biosynthesis [Palleronia aestuarii]
MKALVVSHAHPAFSIGGAQVASWNLYEGLGAQPGWEAHYLAGVAPPVVRHKATPLMSLGRGPNEMLYHSSDFDWFHLGSKDLDDLMAHFERYLRELRPDVVNFHHVMGFGMQAIRAVRRALGDVPIVYTLHEYLPICAHHGQMIKPATHALCTKASPSECGMCFPEIGAGNMLRREMFVKSFFNEVDAFVSPSHFLLSRFEQWGLPAEKLVMIENGLDGGPIAPLRPALPGAKRNRFAYFGQLNPFKGIKVLVEAVTRVPKEVWGDSILYVYGGNLEHQPETFQAQVKELFRIAGGRIRFRGSYKSHELPNLMREVDWMIVPSTWWENSPVVIQEAFHHGRPLIVSDIGGMAEKVRHGIDGLHFHVSSAESLAERMGEAISDPALWTRLRAGIRPPMTSLEAGRRHAELFSKLAARRAPMREAV